MKIVYIARSRLGAMGEAALTQYVGKVSASHRVEVIEHPSTEAIVAPPPKGVRIHTLPSTPFRARLHEVFDILQSSRPDIVHMIQSPYCYDYFMELQPVFSGMKWVLDFRSPHVGAPNAKSLQKFQDMHLHVDLLLTHSMASLRTNIRRRWRRAIEIPPGIDVGKFLVAEKVASSLQSFVYVGSLSKTRKIEVLIEGFDRFARASGQDVRLDVIGTGNAEDTLREEVRFRGADAHIRFVGMMEQTALWQHLANYDAGIAYVPHENFASAPSLKSIEYAAAGLPVLASGTPGHKSFAKAHGFHFRYFHGTAASFADAAEALSASGDLADMVSGNRQAAERLDWQRIIDERLIPAYELIAR